MRVLAFLSLLAALYSPSLRADDAGWVSLYNGKDLSNWVNVNCAPETWTAQGDVIHCTGHPIGALRTPRQYENFILELDWRHLKPAGNSGIFVWGSPIAAPGAPFLRAIEVQVLDNAYNVPGKNQWYTTHGDVFPIWGSTMKPIHKGNEMRCFPIEERSKSSPEWNHYRVVGNDGKLRLSVNGKEVSGGDDVVWRKGYLALESEGSPVEFRNIRIQELPPTGATAENSAPVEEGWRPLYNGLNFRGWRAGRSREGWSSNDWRIACKAGAKPLISSSVYHDFELIVDVGPGTQSSPSAGPHIILGAANAKTTLGLAARPKEWTRNRIIVVRRSLQLRAIGAEATSSTTLPSSGPWSIGLDGGGAAIEFGNIYVRTGKPGKPAG
ncbi:MAG TPA: DUF1080 domain-containing protein [Planctomycetaceae bacterium]|nr:DUF1080 domain-containing protein [Planctomycetaceae bacterium]